MEPESDSMPEVPEGIIQLSGPGPFSLPPYLLCPSIVTLSRGPLHVLPQALSLFPRSLSSTPPLLYHFMRLDVHSAALSPSLSAVLVNK
ncbi:uncharacterized [Lates japonicus]